MIKTWQESVKPTSLWTEQARAMNAEISELRRENERLRDEWLNSAVRESELRTKLVTQPVQEPFAWVEVAIDNDDFDADSFTLGYCMPETPNCRGWYWKALYAVPVQPALLTDKQVSIALETWFSKGLEDKGFKTRMRAAIDAAIKGEIK